MVNIPDWEDAAEAVKSGTASPLDLFVYHNEPAGKQDVEFRNQLQALLEYVSGLTPRPVDAASRRSSIRTRPPNNPPSVPPPPPPPSR